MADDGLMLVYDGECEFCSRLARWVELHDRDGRVRVRPNQEPGLIEALGLTREEVLPKLTGHAKGSSGLVGRFRHP